MKESHFRAQMLARIRIEIHCPFADCGNIIDEFSIATTQVEHCVLGANPTIEKNVR
jgi:hypothetical protein